MCHACLPSHACLESHASLKLACKPPIHMHARSRFLCNLTQTQTRPKTDLHAVCTYAFQANGCVLVVCANQDVGMPDSVTAIVHHYTLCTLDTSKRSGFHSALRMETHTRPLHQKARPHRTSSYPITVCVAQALHIFPHQAAASS